MKPNTQTKSTKHFLILNNTVNIPAKKMIVFALSQVIKMDIGSSEEMLMKFNTLLDVIKNNPNFPDVLSVKMDRKVNEC